MSSLQFTSPLKAAVFDFDGVLCDSIGTKSSAFKRWVPERYAHLRSDFMAYHMSAYGVGRRAQIAHFFEHIVGEPLSEQQLDVEVAELSRLNRETIFQALLYPGVNPFLERLISDGMTISILSGTPQAELEALIEHHQLGKYMSTIIGTPTTKVEGLKRILADQELQPEELVFFGDAEADYRAAETVGVNFVYKPSEVPFLPNYNGKTIDDFVAILNAETPRNL